jgi:uncharacterized protein YyaL (SSP411 family)
MDKKNIDYNNCTRMIFMKRKYNVVVLALLIIFTLGTGPLVFSDAPKVPVVSEEELEEPDVQSRYFNKLIYEKSPYLLNHADNPVDWYPWGDEAFEKARMEDKPIFLSIGYSSCHWCHVMERESYMDFRVAEMLNKVFIPVLVDREERPDIDNLYGLAAEVMTGRRGWPLNIIITTEGKPFFASSYIPKSTRFGQPGLVEITLYIAQMWADNRVELLSAADQVTNALDRVTGVEPGKPLQRGLIDGAFGSLVNSYDEDFGGFSEAPKFPQPHKLLFLLRYWKRTGDERALQMVEKTLVSMRRGGIYDHVGFGFHRYATDTWWRVPHFEKMLHDQAMLAMAYTEAYQATGKEEYADTAREILTYVMRDMSSPAGGFYSAEDAESEYVSGKFYLWKYDEIESILSDSELAIARKVFHIEERGNFVEELTGAKTIVNILYMTKPIDSLADELDFGVEELEGKLETIRKKLYKARDERIHPHKDEKILTDWNGLMIAAFAKAAAVFDDRRFGRRAERAAQFLLREMRDGDGRLLHRTIGGHASIRAYADDYSHFAWGLLELYETTFKVQYLKAALELNNEMIDHFWDPERGGFFYTASDTDEMFLRHKELYDGAYPSGNAVAMHNLLILGRITANPEFDVYAQQIGQIVSRSAYQNPGLFTHLMGALDFATGVSYELVIAGNTKSEDTTSMVRAVHRKYLPNKVIVFRPTDERSPDIFEFADYIRYQNDIDGKATAYVCVRYLCKDPTTDIDKMIVMLNEN